MLQELLEVRRNVERLMTIEGDRRSGVRVRRATTQAISANPTTLSYSDIVGGASGELNNAWDVANPTRLVAETDGWYHLGAGCSFIGGSTAVQIYIVLNTGAFVAYGLFVTERCHCECGWVYMTAGQYAEVKIYGTTTATATATINDAGAIYNYAYIYKVA